MIVNTRTTNLPIEIWCSVLSYVLERRDMKRLAFVNTQLTRIVQPELFKSVELRWSRNADQLYGLLINKPTLCAQTTELRILSDYRPDLLRWLRSKAGVFVLRHMSAVTKMQLEETDLRGIELIECIQHLSQHITINSFRILGCWVPNTCTVKSAVFSSLLTLFPDLEALEITTSNARPDVGYYTHSDDESISLDRLNATVHGPVHEQRSISRVQKFRIRGAQKHAHLSYTGWIYLVMSLVDLSGWLSQSVDPRNMQVLDLLIWSRDDLSMFLELYRQTVDTVKSLKLSVPHQLQDHPEGHSLTYQTMPKFESLPPLKHARNVEAQILAGAQSRWIPDPPRWVSELLLALLPARQPTQICQVVECLHIHI
jgi:hypothetical protein